MRKIWTLMVGLMLLTAAWQAHAQNPENVADVRCVLVGFRFQLVGNSAQKASGLMLTLYYLGRLDGRNRGHDIEELVAAEAREMTGADYDSEAERCAKSLAKKGQEIARIGEDVAKHQQKIPQRPVP